MNEYRKKPLGTIAPRRLLYPALLFLAAAAVAVNFGQGRALWQTLARGRWWWVAVAAFLQLLFILNQSALYTAIYRMFGLPASLGHFSLLVMAASFVSAVVPGGTISGTGLILYDAQAKKLELARSLLANLTYYLFDYLAFLATLTLAICYLLIRGNLTGYEIAAAVTLAALVASIAFGLAFIARRPATISAMVIGLMNRLENLSFPRKLTGRIAEGKTRANDFIWQLSSALNTITRDHAAFLLATAHALLVEGIGLLQLEALFLAFNQNPGPGRLLTGYAIGVLFMIISITPQGVGFAEGAMTAAYASLGIPLEQAITVTFIYRGLSFWVPMLCGSLVLKRVVSQW
ncbi:MAG: lysylphosphatidylglycerol synthase transmembrane domain-containing protein [Thermacetogeniaceae bacterium]